MRDVVYIYELTPHDVTVEDIRLISCYFSPTEKSEILKHFEKSDVVRILRRESLELALKLLKIVARVSMRVNIDFKPCYVVYIEIDYKNNCVVLEVRSIPDNKLFTKIVVPRKEGFSLKHLAIGAVNNIVFSLKVTNNVEYISSIDVINLAEMIMRTIVKS